MASAAVAGEPIGWHLSLDNDYFNFWQAPNDRPDAGYTHGTDLAAHLPHVGGPLRWLAHGPLGGPDRPGQRTYGVLSLRQDIYMPFTREGDRPYAGWLELGMGVARESEGGLHEARVRLGVTGPPSLAERTQAWIHKSFGFKRERGWSTQLPFEPGGSIEYTMQRRVMALASEGSRWESALGGRARLGTFASDLTLGGQTVLGNEPPPPWEAAEGRQPSALAVWVSAGAQVALIGRNEFLDGTFFRTSPEIGKLPLVPEGHVGLGVQYRRLRVGYRFVRRGREYEGQPHHQNYSTLSLAWVGGTAR